MQAIHRMYTLAYVFISESRLAEHRLLYIVVCSKVTLSSLCVILIVATCDSPPSLPQVLLLISLFSAPLDKGMDDFLMIFL